MLRFLPVLFVGAVFATAVLAAGHAADLPPIVDLAFVACLVLFFVAVLTGTTNNASEESNYFD